MEADTTSEEQCILKNKIQPFARQFFEAISSVQLLAAKDSQALFPPKPLWMYDNLSAVDFAFDLP